MNYNPEALDQPFVDWGAVEKDPAFQEADNGRKIQMFDAWAEYSGAYLDKRKKEGPESDFAKFDQGKAEQTDWVNKTRSELAKQYTFEGMFAEEDDTNTILETLRDTEGLKAKGFSDEQVQEARKRAEDFLMPQMEAFHNNIGGLAGQGPGYNKEQLRQKIWEDPNLGDHLRNIENGLALGFTSVLLGTGQGLASLGGMVGIPGATEAADWARDQKEMFQEQLPLDPRMNWATNAVVGGATQAPAQILTAPALPVQITANFGQMFAEDSDRFFEAEKKVHFEEMKASGQLPDETPYSDFEKKLSKDELEEMRARANWKAIPSSLVNTVGETISEKLALKGIPWSKVPYGKTIQKQIDNLRKANPKMAVGARMFTNVAGSAAVGGTTEVAQGAISGVAEGALVTGEYDGVFKGAGQNFVGGAAGDTAMSFVPSAVRAFREQAMFEDANSIVDGTASSIKGLKTQFEAAVQQYGEDSTQANAVGSAIRNQEDEAHYHLSLIGGVFDETRAKRGETMAEAKNSFRTQLARWIKENQVGDYTPEKEIQKKQSSDLAGLKSQVDRMRQGFRQNGDSTGGTLEAGLDQFEQNEAARIQREADEKRSKADAAVTEFIGSVGQDGPGRASYARVVVGQMFPDFVFSEEFNDDATVVEVLDAVDQDLITNKTDLTQWLNAPVPGAKPTGETTTAPAKQGGLMTTGQRLDAFRLAEDNLAGASENEVKEFGRLKDDINFWNSVLNDKDSNEQDRAEAEQRLPALENALLDLATVSSQSTNQNDQNQTPNQTPLSTQEVPTGSAEGQGAGTRPTIRVKTMDGEEVDQTQEDYLAESRGIVSALQNGEMTPEAALQNVEAVRQEIEAAPELTPEQKQQWASPFDNIPAVVEQLQQGGSVGETLSGERVNIADLKDNRGRIGKQGFTAEGVIDIINFATGSKYDYSASSLKEILNAVKSAPEQVKAIQDFLERTPVKTTLEPDGTTHLDDGHHRAFLADQLGMDSLPTNAIGSETTNKQTPAVTPTAQPTPVRMGGVTGDVTRTESGEVVFRPTDGSPETVLRVKETSIEKDPATLTVADFESGDGTPLVSEANKQFSVLPQNDRPVRPFFRSEPTITSQDGQTAKSSGSYPEAAGSTPAPATTLSPADQTEGGETQNEIQQTQPLREGQTSSSSPQGQSGSSQEQGQEISPPNEEGGPVTGAPDLQAIVADVQANPDIHRMKDGNRKLVSREAAVTILSQLPDTLTNKDVATLAKDSGMTSANFRKLVGMRGDQNAVGSILNGSMDAELGLLDDTLLNIRRERAAKKAPLNDTAPQQQQVSNDTETESTLTNQSQVDRWVNDSFTAIEEKIASMPMSKLAAAGMREKLTTDEGRAQVREKLGQMFNTVARNIGIADPVTKEEALEKIFRGAKSQTGEGLTSNVLNDLLTNVEKTGDPFLVKTKNGEVGYSAWLKHRNKQKEFLDAQGKRDMTDKLVENQGASTTASQGVQEEEGEGTGPSFTEGDPDIEAGRAEAESMQREAIQKSYDKMSRFYAGKYGLDQDAVKTAIAKHFSSKRGVQLDFGGLGWATPTRSKEEKAVAALKDAMPQIEQELIKELTKAIRSATSEANRLGLLKSDPVEISDTPTLEQILGLGIRDEIANPDFYNAISEAKEKNSVEPLKPLLEGIGRTAIRDLQVVAGVVLNDGKPITDAKQLASLTKADMQAVLDSNLLSGRIRQTLQALNDLSGSDGLGIVRTSKNEGFRRLAELYSEQIGNRAPVEVVFNLALNPEVNAQGLWNPGDNRVHISPFLTREQNLMEATILHETMHPIWDGKISDFLNGRLDRLNAKELGAARELERLFTYAKAEALKRPELSERDVTGLGDLREFLNEALNHKPFQDFLNELKDPDSKGKTSIFRKILNEILKLIRGGDVSVDSVLQRAFEVSVDLASRTQSPSQQTPTRLPETRAEADIREAEIFSEAELDSYNALRQMQGESVLASEKTEIESQVATKLALDFLESAELIANRGQPLPKMSGNEARLVNDWRRELLQINADAPNHPYHEQWKSLQTKAGQSRVAGRLKQTALQFLRNNPEKYPNYYRQLTGGSQEILSSAAYEFVSPNDLEESLDLNGAVNELGSQRQAQLREFSGRVHEAFGMQGSTVTDAIGDWADGAEPTTVTEHTNPNLSYEDIKTMAALKGALRNQKAVIPFKVDGNGEQFLYDFFIPEKSLREAREIVAQAGIEFRTLTEQNGGTRVLVFDADGSAFDAFAGLISNNKYESKFLTGNGEFLGSWDSREEGKEVYTRTVAAEIARLGGEGRDVRPDSPEGVRIASLRSLAAEAGLTLDPAPELSVVEALTGQPPTVEEAARFSVSVPFKGKDGAEGKSVSQVLDKAVAEPAQSAFLKPEEFSKALQSLALLVKDPLAGKVKARGGRAVNLNSPDDATARKLEKSTGQRWDQRLLEARVIHALTEEDRTTPNANKIATAPMVPQTLQQADFVARRDFEGRPFLVFAKLYSDPDSPTGVRWHFVEAREDTGAFETQYSDTDPQRGRAMAARVIGIGDSTPKKKKALTEAGYAQGPSGVSSSNPQGILPVPNDQGEVLDNTNVESVQNKISEEIAALNEKFYRLMESGNGEAADKVAAQIDELEQQLAPRKSAAVEDMGSPEERATDALEAAARSFAAKARFLTPEERGKLRSNTRETFVRIFESLPSDKEFAAAALGGQAKRGWYRKSTQAIVDVFGGDAPRFAALLAATSPQTSVENNLINALNIWKNWTAAGRPTDRQAILKVMGASVMGNKGEDSVLDAWVNNSVRALTSPSPENLVISGPKVNSFMLNLRGFVNEVTNDAWMANFALVDQVIFKGSLNAMGTDPGKGPGYLAMSARVRAAARYLTKLTGETWTPAEVQETVWSWAKTLYELQERQGESRTALEILQAGDLTDDAIASTPDFATLLNNGTYRQILVEAGYGDALGRLAQSNTGAVGETQRRFDPEAGSAIGKTLRTLQEKSAKRLTLLYRQRQEESARKAATSNSVEGEPPTAPLASRPVPFSGSITPGFNPTVYTNADRRQTGALARVRTEPEYRAVQAALGSKSYFKYTEAETLTKANEFIDANGGDLEKAYIKAGSAHGLTSEQTIVARGLVLKRATAAANAARAGKADPNVSAQQKTNFAIVEQHYTDLAETFAEGLMEMASLAGQELRAFRMLADALTPQSWGKVYKKAATKAQKKKIEKDPALREAMARIKEARRIAANSTTTRMLKALAIAAKRFVPEGTSDEEIAAYENFDRLMASNLPVREEVMKAAIERTVISGVDTIRRAMAPQEQVPESFLREWEDRLRNIASQQINDIIETRLQGGKIDEELPAELSDSEKEALREQKIMDAWREFSDYPLAEMVFNLARSTIVASDSPYANLVRRAQFDPARINALQNAVKMTINTAEEIRKSVTDRRMSVESLKLRLAEANPSLNEAQLGSLASAVEAVYNDEVEQATRAALDRVIKTHAEKKAAKVLQDPNVIDKLLPLVNMGAFSDEAAYNAIAEGLRLPTWNSETAAQIEEKAKALQALPEGSLQRQEAGQTLMLDILKANIKEAKGAGHIGHIMQISSALWSAGILSAPPTQIVNASMTGVSVFLESFMEATGYWTRATLNGASQEQAREYFKDIARAWLFAFGKDANNTSLRAINEAYSSLTTGRSKFKSEKLEYMSPLEMFKFDPRVAIPGNAMMDAIISGEYLKATKEAAKMAVGVPVTMADRLGKKDLKGAVKDYMATAKLVGRLMMAADSVNSYGAATAKQMMMMRYLAQEEGMAPDQINEMMRKARKNEEESISDGAMAQVQTEDEQGNFGPAGTKAHDVARARRLEQIIEQQTYGADTVNAGRDFAALATFNSEPYGVVGWLMDTLFAGPTKILGLATKPINPFPKTMSNLINSALNYTPYGSLRAEGVNIGAFVAAVPNFPEQFVRETPERGTPEYFALHARALAGSAAMGTFALMLMGAVKDRKEKKEPWFEIHGPGPSDPAQLKQWAASGAKKFTVKIGQGDGALVVSYTDWPGINIALGVLGTLYDQMVYSDAEMETADWMSQTARAVTMVTLNRSALGGASALMEFLSASTPEVVAKTKFQQLASSYVTGFTRPSFVRWAETVVTGQRQETRTTEGWLLSLTPVVSAFRGRPALNILGEPIETSAWDATAGRVATSQQTHPVLTSLTNAQLWIPPAQRYDLFDDSQPTMVRKMTEAEFYNYGKYYGESLREIVTPAMAESLAELAKTAPNTAQEMLTNLSNTASKIAKAKMAGGGLIKGKKFEGP